MNQRDYSREIDRPDTRKFELTRQQTDPLLDRSHPSQFRPIPAVRSSSQSSASIRDLSFRRDYNHDFVPSREYSVPEYCPEVLKHQRDLVLLDTLPVLEEDKKMFEFPLCNSVLKSAESHRKVLEQISKLAELIGHTGTFVTAPWEAVPAAEKLRETKAEIDMRTELEQELNRNNRPQTLDRLIGVSG
jgi:hypothetical protein